jgi:hypothetical protein
MPKRSLNLEQLELYRPHSVIPDWKILPEKVRERALQELARMLRDRLDQIAAGEDQGGSTNE